MISGFELHMGVFGRFLVPASLGAAEPPRKARLRSTDYFTARRGRQSFWRESGNSPLPETAPGNRMPGADMLKPYSSKTE